MPHVAVFPIGYVSISTGLSAHVLRAWERRYKAVEPGRSVSGRRLYTQENIERILLLKRAVARGNSISQIAGLDDATLADLAGINHGGHRPEPLESELSGVAAGSAAGDVIEACLQAMAELNDARLLHLLQMASLKHSRQAIIESVIVPFMAEIGSRWSVGKLRIVYEHMASSVVYACISQMLIRHKSADLRKPRMLIATPAGQSCFLGALAVAVTAQDQGWKPIFLGPDLPSEDIAAARIALKPELIALSISCRVNDAFIENELQRLAHLLGRQCPYIVGGVASGAYRRIIERSGGEWCPTTGSLIDRFAKPVAARD